MLAARREADFTGAVRAAFPWLVAGEAATTARTPPNRTVLLIPQPESGNLDTSSARRSSLPDTELPLQLQKIPERQIATIVRTLHPNRE